jgi:hypothetical protein
MFTATDVFPVPPFPLATETIMKSLSKILKIEFTFFPVILLCPCGSCCKEQ